MKIRKFNSKSAFKVVEGDFQCCWCEAGRTQVDWGEDGGTIFLENDQGEVRMIDGEPLLAETTLLGQSILLRCTPITANEARRIIAEHASS